MSLTVSLPPGPTASKPSSTPLKNQRLIYYMSSPCSESARRSLLQKHEIEIQSGTQTLTTSSKSFKWRDPYISPPAGLTPRFKGHLSIGCSPWRTVSCTVTQSLTIPEVLESPALSTQEKSTAIC